MSQIRLTRSRRGLAGFPAAFRIVGRDDGGDVLAVDEAGKVWSFAHGTGDWESRTPAFASEAQLADYVASQGDLEPPRSDESEAELKARVKRIKTFRRGQRGAPFSRDVISTVLEEIRERLAELRFSKSRRGLSLARRQEIGRRCVMALEEAGAGEWLVGAHAERKRGLVVAGPFTDPWTEEAVTALLQPLTEGCELVFYKQG